MTSDVKAELQQYIGGDKRALVLDDMLIVQLTAIAQDAVFVPSGKNRPPVAFAAAFMQHAAPKLMQLKGMQFGRQSLDGVISKAINAAGGSADNNAELRMKFQRCLEEGLNEGAGAQGTQLTRLVPNFETTTVTGTPPYHQPKHCKALLAFRCPNEAVRDKFFALFSDMVARPPFIGSHGRFLLVGEKSGLSVVPHIHQGDGICWLELSNATHREFGTGDNSAREKLMTPSNEVDVQEAKQCCLHLLQYAGLISPSIARHAGYDPNSEGTRQTTGQCVEMEEQKAVRGGSSGGLKHTQGAWYR